MSFDDFDPFNDGLSRDIRNTLSETFVDSHCLTFITNLNVLMESIKNLDPVPPKLINPALREV